MSEDTTQRLPGGDLGEVLSILRSMNTRLTALEDKVERRLHDTRPIWEQVLTRLTNVEERLTKVEERLTAVEDRLTGVEQRLTNVEERLTNVEERLTKVETGLGRVEGEVDDLGLKFRVFTSDILKLHHRDDKLEERLTRVEAEQSR